MSYYSNDVPWISQQYGFNIDEKTPRVICSAAGQIKVLNCDPDILEEVLSYVDGNNSFAEIERKFVDRFSLQDIKSFLNTILDEGIIESRTEEIISNKNPKLLVIGDGVIFESLVRDKNICIDVDDFLRKDNIYDFDIAVFAPSTATYADMLAVNKKLYHTIKPFIPIFYSGGKILAGPLVVPNKSACLECVLSHELKCLNSKLPEGEKVGIREIQSLKYSCNLPKSINSTRIQYIIRCVVDDLIKYNAGMSSDFLDYQYFFELDHPKFAKEQISPTTYCDFCNGMNKNYIHFEANSMNFDSLLHGKANVNSTILIRRDVKYEVGGLRSTSEKETLKILNNELSKFGTKIRVEPAIGNPFNDNNAIHCYNSFIEQTNNAKIPFLFRTNEGAGKGSTKTQSYFSAAFELLEHAGLQYAGDIPIVCAKYKDVKEIAIDLPYLASTVKNQNTAFDDFDEYDEVDWVVATSLTDGTNRLVPAFLVFMYDVELKGRFFASSSNGAAIATTLEDAILHGLFEAVERDAWLICQSNPYVLPVLDYTSVVNPQIKKIINRIREMGYDIITRDYTTDLGIPVYRTWIVNKNDYSRYAYNGLGCHVLPELALERSITEAVQVEDWSDTGGDIDSNMITEEVLNKSLVNLYNQHFLVNKDVFGKTEKQVPIRKSLFNIKSSYDTMRQVANLIKKKVGGDVYYVDLTKTGMNVKIARTVITGDFQRMNIPLISVCDRMFEFGINCGYGNKKTVYEELFMGQYAH